jgi:uncharacterized protein (DUF427 family)
MPKGESLFHQYPDCRVELQPHPERVVLRAGGEILADSTAALCVRETKHEPVLYFPRKDVRLERLVRTDHHTFCPFKGEASYWTIETADAALENAAWSYEDPFEEVDGLKDYLAFYPDRVEQTT